MVWDIRWYRSYIGIYEPRRLLRPLLVLVWKNVSRLGSANRRPRSIQLALKLQFSAHRKAAAKWGQHAPRSWLRNRRNMGRVVSSGEKASAAAAVAKYFKSLGGTGRRHGILTGKSAAVNEWKMPPNCASCCRSRRVAGVHSTTRNGTSFVSCPASSSPAVKPVTRLPFTSGSHFYFDFMEHAGTMAYKGR